MDAPTGADGPTGTRPCAGSFIAATVREMRWVMMVGIGLIGTVSATVAAWFVSHKRTREDAARAKALADHPESAAELASDPVSADTDRLVGTLASLSAQIEVLARQQGELRATIERLVDQRGTP